MLLIKVSLYGHFASIALLKICLFGALSQFVICIRADFDNLCATCAISEHHTVKHVVQIHFIWVDELRMGNATELTCVLLAAIVINGC